MSGSQEEASTVADGRLSDGSRSSQTSPRTPEGPSETRMRRSPIFSIGQVVQKSRPVRSRTFSSSVSVASRSAIVLSAGAAAVCVINGFLRLSARAGGASGHGAGLDVLFALDLQQAVAFGAALLLLDRVGHRRGQEQPLGIGVLRMRSEEHTS